ncbi:Glycerophosphoryl diester phosphodiesterase [Minicystis rosea]|nr:Glycerophosphoryl diester phosphodiesterase [Minicystis rosea]
MPAFAMSAEEGAEALELDVRVCASGELVVAHDPDLKRITEGADTRAVADLTLDELSQIALAGGARVPTLSEVLSFARERRLAVNVEMKRDAPSRTAIVRATARLLHRWDPKHALIVSSFDPAMLSGLAVLAPHVPRAVLVHQTRWHTVHAATRIPVGAAAVHLDRRLTDPAAVRALLRRALVNVWTINDPDEARDLAALGVDGLITDVPGLIREALDE